MGIYVKEFFHLLKNCDINSKKGIIENDVNLLIILKIKFQN